MAVYGYADEAARKKAAGIPLNNGVIPKTTSQSAKTVYQPMSATQAAGKTTTNTTGGFIPATTTTAASSGLKQAQGMSASAAGVGTISQGSIPPIYNAATNTTGETPTLGYGSGGTYGKTSGLGSAYKANTALIGTDAGKQSEIARTQSVISARKLAGLDTSGQEKYLRVNLGYAGTDTAATDQPDYKALAEAEWLSLLNDKTRTAEEKKNSLKSAWDYSNRLLTDNRTLEDVTLDRTLNPFSGQKNYAVGLVGRERELSDAEALARYNSAIGEIDSELGDYKNSAAQEIMKRAYELEQRGQDNARADAAITGEYNGTRTIAGQQLDLEKMKTDIQKGQWDKSFDLEMQKWADQKGLNWAQLSLETKKALAGMAIDQMNASTSRMNAGTSAASLAWSKDPSNPDNILKNVQIDEAGKPDLNKAFDQLSSIYVSKDPYSGAATVSNPSALRSAVIGLGLSDSDTDRMLLQFGLQPN